MQTRKMLSILTVALFAFSVFVVTNADVSDGLSVGDLYVNGVDAVEHPELLPDGCSLVEDTLTLNNATLYRSHTSGVDSAPIFFTDGDAILNIVLVGENNSITGEGSGDKNGIFSKGRLNISGTGSLTISGCDYGIFTWEKGIRISGGNITIEGDCDASVWSSNHGTDGGGLTMTGGNLIVDDEIWVVGSNGFRMEGGSITLRGLGSVIKCIYQAVAGQHFVMTGGIIQSDWTSPYLVHVDTTSSGDPRMELANDLLLYRVQVDADLIEIALPEGQGYSYIGYRVSEVTFNGNGGTPVTSSMNTSNVGKLPSLPGDPTRQDCTFGGWYTAAEGGEQVTASTTFYVDTTVYAHWSSGPSGFTHTVTYDVNGGSAAAPTQDAVAEGATFTAASYEGTRSGFEFGGWSYDGSVYKAGDTITMGTSNITLKAIWNKVTSGVEGQIKWTVVGNKLIIEKNSDDGAMNDYTEDSRPAWESVEGWKDVTTIEIADDVTKISAHAFCKCTVLSKLIIPATVASVGDDAFGSFVFYKDGTGVANTADNLKGKTWVGSGTEKKMYNLDAAGEMKITFKVEGGVATSELLVTFGQKLPSLPDAKREGYTFDGWYDASGKKITADYVFTADTTVTAKWIKEESKFEMTSGMIIALATVLTVIGVAVVARFAVKKE